MKKVLLFAGTFAVFCLYACSDSKKSEETGVNDFDSTIQNTASESMQMPVEVASDSVVMPANQTAPAVTTTAPGMNPPHGQPGHRCDIDVGAPLNSPPGKTSQATPITIQEEPVTPDPPAANVVSPPQPVMQTQPVVPGQATAPGKTAPGMNPPHGEPGHDCSIAVGAPLKK